FSLRSMWSGAAFHQAYLHATQQAFLAAHQDAFRYFGGVFHQLRYGNLSSAVKKVLRGRRREETDRFIAFRSHWQFDASFCTPGKGREKGGVEGEAGFFRRNHLVPAPQASSLAALNESLLEGCRKVFSRINCAPAPLDPAEIKRGEFSTRPLPALTAYDQLLSQPAQSFVK